MKIGRLPEVKAAHCVVGNLAQCICQVRYWDAEMPDRICAEPSLNELTLKQQEAVKLLVDCHSTKEIARRLNISPSTVEQRLMSVRRKYGLLSRRDVQRHFRQSDMAKLEGVFVQTSEAPVSLPDRGTGRPTAEISATQAETPADRRVSGHQLALAISLGVLLGWGITVLATLLGVLVGRFLIG